MDRRIMTLLVFLVLVGLAAADPKFTAEFRGQAYANGEVVPDGTKISVWGNGGQTLMDTAAAGYGHGYYNHLEVNWDNTQTSSDKGVAYNFEGEEVIFKIDDREVERAVITRSDSGKTINLDLYSGFVPVEVQSPQDFSAGLFFIAALIIVGLIVLFVIFTKKKNATE